MPPPKPFAKVEISGVTPYPIYAIKEPVLPIPLCTSSNMRRQSLSSANFLRPSRNGFSALMMPDSPRMGSTKIAAVFFVKTFFTDLRSLKVALLNPLRSGPKPVF